MLEGPGIDGHDVARKDVQLADGCGARDEGPLVTTSRTVERSLAAADRLLAGSALASINIWTGAPLLAVWVGSQIQAAQDRLSMTALFAVVVALAVTVFALAWLLAYFNGRYDELIGRRRRPATPPRGFAACAASARRTSAARWASAESSASSILAVVAAVLAFEIWFFFFAGICSKLGPDRGMAAPRPAPRSDARRGAPDLYPMAALQRPGRRSQTALPNALRRSKARIASALVSAQSKNLRLTHS